MSAESIRLGNESNDITIHFVNQAGSGFVEDLDVPAGTTLQRFCNSRRENNTPTVNMHNCFVRVGGEEKPGSYVLQPGDRVSATLKKVAGA